MFPPGGDDGYRGRFDGDFRLGLSLWTQDYPRADRHFSQAVRRLTRMHVRSVEQPVNLDEGDALRLAVALRRPGGRVGAHRHQGKALREYLLRGGFFMADDFHGAYEWQVFERAMKKVFPDRPIVDIAMTIPSSTPSTIWTTATRFRAGALRAGYKNRRRRQRRALARHLRRQRPRMVAISYNSDLGDAWEYADDPRYPEKWLPWRFASGINYIIYAMTH